MGSLSESFRREEVAREKAEQQAAGQAETTEVAKPKVERNKTFEEIRGDDAASARFIRFLTKNKNSDLEVAFVTGGEHPDRLNRETQRKLVEEKEKFLLLMESSDALLKTLNAETIINLAEKYPDLKDALELGGPRRIQEALRRKLPDLAINDPLAFEAMSSSIEGRASQEKKRDEREREIRAEFKKLGIDGDAEIAKVMNGDDPGRILKESILRVAKNKAQEKINDDARFWSPRKLFGIRPTKQNIRKLEIEIGGDIKKLAQASADELRGYRTKIDSSIGQLAWALEATLTRNTEMHDALVSSSYGNDIPDVETASFSDARTAMRVDVEDVKAKWKDQLRKAQYGQWLQKERDKQWDQYVDRAVTREAVIRLEEEGLTITDAARNQKKAELMDEFNSSPERKARFWQAFLEEYAEAPQPPEDLTKKWDKQAAELDSTEFPPLVDAFVDEYAADHMANRSQGKKQGFFSRSVSEFFKSSLTDMFQMFH